jgi:hypothetical protein
LKELEKEKAQVEAEIDADLEIGENAPNNDIGAQ